MKHFQEKLALFEKCFEKSGDDSKPIQLKKPRITYSTSDSNNNPHSVSSSNMTPKTPSPESSSDPISKFVFDTPVHHLKLSEPAMKETIITNIFKELDHFIDEPEKQNPKVVHSILKPNEPQITQSKQENDFYEVLEALKSVSEAYKKVEDVKHHPQKDHSGSKRSIQRRVDRLELEVAKQEVLMAKV